VVEGAALEIRQTPVSFVLEKWLIYQLFRTSQFNKFCSSFRQFFPNPI